MTTREDLPEGHDVYNTTVAVVANIPARGEADAIDQLRIALERAGFGVYDEPSTQNAFAAEDGTEVSDEFDPCGPTDRANRR